MKSIEWKCAQFSQLNIDELYELTKLRIDIFVVEQNCPYSELDEKDRHPGTLHFMGLVDETLICYARLLAPDTSYPEASIGRFAVISSQRKQGIGRKLMQQCLTTISHHWPEQDIRISAQQHLKKFYASFDFTQTSEMYLEDGIPHIEMLKSTCESK